MNKFFLVSLLLLLNSRSNCMQSSDQKSEQQKNLPAQSYHSLMVSKNNKQVPELRRTGSGRKFTEQELRNLRSAKK